MTPKKRFYQLDLFRFIAALAVVLYHYLFRGYSADSKSILDFSEIGGFFKYGYLGVDLFFIISGFVILLSIEHKSLVKFIISRISRLYPIYWICVLLTFFVIVLFGSPRYTADIKQLSYNLTMFHNYLDIKNIDSVYWTLFIEMKFYIFIVGFYLILNKIKQIKLDYLIYFWTLLSILYICFNDLYIARIARYFFILDWSSYFIAGIVFYQVFKNGLKLKNWILLSTCLCISIYHAIPRVDLLESKYDTSFSPYIISIIIILFYIIMLLFSTHKLNRINSPKLIKLGMLTYPLYLIHQNIGYIIFNKLASTMNKYILLTGTIIVMITISYFLSKSYEPRFSLYLKTKLGQLTKKLKWN